MRGDCSGALERCGPRLRLWRWARFGDCSATAAAVLGASVVVAQAAVAVLAGSVAGVQGAPRVRGGSAVAVPGGFRDGAPGAGRCSVTGAGRARCCWLRGGLISGCGPGGFGWRV